MTTSLRDGSAPAPVGIADAPADPVKTLLQQHHALCAGAVDPWEIAAGLEVRGIGDREAAEYRHRDVFSLAEELHARVEHGQQPGTGAPDAESPAAPGHPRGRCAALRCGWGAGGTLAWLWLLASGLTGDRTLTVLLHGARGTGVHALLAAAAPAGLALACAVVPAACCAHWFAGRARRALRTSRGLKEFGARVRPALLTAVVLYLGALLLFLWSARSALPADGTAAPAGTAPVPAYVLVAALGGLLFLARLLASYGRTRAAVHATLAAGAAQAVPLCALLAARLPGCDALGWPVRWAAGACTPAAIPLAACVLPALALLVHAVPALSRASVHSEEQGT
ncbi:MULTISPECIES: hypothetical protein [Streptomyces]|uniref:Integral membrane protein n=1 Tax=Streptomyces morookaense TaxID=1970 RepID=A0A7Y7B8Q0_STRMO|nr:MULTISPECIES: hypothetical protein [Streptomyces]MCC2279031.1 hypothetical protein [Streptomyces sp. ET3-23]NVK81098.1 hypothetical protein [Streptomyces morookaense]GHF14876.1 hypothetical protein GCM10010359_15240 [Streptomyces morookaense]